MKVPVDVISRIEQLKSIINEDVSYSMFSGSQNISGNQNIPITNLKTCFKAQTIKLLRFKNLKDIVDFIKQF